MSNNEQVDVRLEITEKVVEQFRTTVSDFRKDLNTYATGEKLDEERVNSFRPAHTILKNIQSFLTQTSTGGSCFQDQELIRNQ